MNRADYAFHDLSFDEYTQIVTAATMQGVSPMQGQGNYDAAIAVCRQAGVDLRALLAGTLFEDHDGTDPNGGVALAAVYNFGGIKWANQPGAYDSGIAYPLNEGVGDYAGFHDLGGFMAELIRTLTNDWCGPSFATGDLAGAWAIYIGGPNNPNHAGGQARVDQFSYYLGHYPPVQPAPVDTGVYGEDLIAYLRTLIGEASSTAETDPVNGVHPWAYWCESLAERVPEHFGLQEVHRGSAYVKGLACQAQGMFRPDNTPQHGDWVIMGPGFYYPDGHIFFWDAERGQGLGTVTDGTGIGYRNWNQNTIGFMGCCPVPGVTAPHRGTIQPVPPVDPPHPFMQQNWVPGTPENPNPYDHNPGVKGLEIGIGGGFLAKFRQTPDPWTIFGWPMHNEEQAYVDGALMTVQRFERGTLVYDPHAPGPWDVVVALDTAVIQRLKAD